MASTETDLQPMPAEANAEIAFVREKSGQLFAQMRRVLVGHDEVLLSLLATIFCQGHALLEGVPGTAKTLMVRAVARTMSLDFSRIQFTPDLMPSDIVGTNVFDLSRNAFTLRHGPVFTDLLLGDEINRSP